MSFKPKNFREWCNHTIPVLPQVYGDELSYYELLNKVIERCNEIGLTINELIDYVNHYFDSLDVQNMINKKLDEMAQDGTLADLINHKIFNDLNEKIDEVALSANEAKEYAKPPFYSYVDGVLDRQYRKLFYLGDKYYYPQGFCTSDDGNIKYVCLTNPNDDVVTFIVQSSDGKQSVELNGHGNSCCIYNGTLVVCATFTGLKNNKYNSNVIYVLNVDTLALIQTVNVEIATGESISIVSKDTTNNNLYVGGWKHMYLLDNSFRVVSSYQQNAFSNLEYQTAQGGCVYDGYLYALFSPNNLVCVWKLGTADVRSVFGVGQVANEMWFIGELEDMNVIGDCIYVSSAVAVGPSSEYEMCQVFCLLNATPNGKHKASLPIPHTGSPAYYTSLYVDNNVENDWKNPTGREENPFFSVMEAVDVIKVGRTIKQPLYINLKKSTKIYDCFHAYDLHGVRLLGNDNTVTNVKVIGCSAINITGLTSYDSNLINDSQQFNIDVSTGVVLTNCYGKIRTTPPDCIFKISASECILIGSASASSDQYDIKSEILPMPAFNVTNSIFIDSHRLRSVNANSNSLTLTSYPIFVGSLSVSDTPKNLNGLVKNGAIKYNDLTKTFKYITFYYTNGYSTRVEACKQIIANPGNDSSYQLRLVNLPDSIPNGSVPSGVCLQVLEVTVILRANGTVEVTHQGALQLSAGAGGGISATSFKPNPVIIERIELSVD